MKKKRTANGGTLHIREKGDPAPPGAGRKENPWKFAIRKISEREDGHVLMDGILADKSGNSTGHKVKVFVQMPAVEEVIYTMFARAKKGDVQAAKWLQETGYGRTISEDEKELPIFSGFTFIMEDHRQQSENEPTD